MMGRKHREQASLFYEFRLDDMIPKGHVLRRINVFVTYVLGDLQEQLGPFYSDIGRSSIDPELLIRMLIIGYCFGIRSERKLCEEVRLHLAYRWFCRLDLNDAVPHHSTFSENRLNRFRESDILRHIFERVVFAAMEMGLVTGEGFAVDASVMEANAGRYHGKAPDELDWTEKQQRKRAVTEYLAALEAEAVADGDAQNDNESGGPEGKRPRRHEPQPPKVITSTITIFVNLGQSACWEALVSYSALIGADRYHRGSSTIAVSSFLEIVQAIAAEASDYSRRSLERRSSFVEKLFRATSFESALLIQSDYARTSYAGLITYLRKMDELYSNLVKEAVKPFEEAIANFQR